MGELTERFESEFAESIGVGHAVAVSSCTAALHLALLAIDVGAGDDRRQSRAMGLTGCHEVEAGHRR